MNKLFKFVIIVQTMALNRELRNGNDIAGSIVAEACEMIECEIPDDIGAAAKEFVSYRYGIASPFIYNGMKPVWLDFANGTKTPGLIDEKEQ